MEILGKLEVSKSLLGTLRQNVGMRFVSIFFRRDERFPVIKFTVGR